MNTKDTQTQSIPVFLNPVPIFSNCSYCEHEFSKYEFHSLPETDKAYPMPVLEKIS